MANMARVLGTTKAQYTQKFLWMTFDWLQSREGIAKSAAKNVAGRKAMVMTAMIFMEVLSSKAAWASFRVMVLVI